MYQIAKNYVTGLYQHIVFDEYLPMLLGRRQYDRYIGNYRYEHNIDPTMFI